MNRQGMECDLSCFDSPLEIGAEYGVNRFSSAPLTQFPRQLPTSGHEWRIPPPRSDPRFVVGTRRVELEDDLDLHITDAVQRRDDVA